MDQQLHRKVLRRMETYFLIKMPVALELECTLFLHFVFFIGILMTGFMQHIFDRPDLRNIFCREAGYSILSYSFLIFLVFLNFFGKQPKNPIRIILLL